MDIITHHIDGGWLTITPEDVKIENEEASLEIAYWHHTEWNGGDEDESGDAEAAVACINAIMAALEGGVPRLYRICPSLKDRPD